jgi:hypothetical protein
MASLAQAGIAGGDKFASVALPASGGELEVQGQLTNTVKGASVLTVAGQTVQVSAGTKVLTASGSSAASLPAKGAMVAVYGSLNSDGTIAASQIRVLNESYVPGATSIYVHGVVTAVNTVLATAKVGSLSIDYSASLYDSSAQSIQVNSVAGFTGVQTGGAAATLFASKVVPAGIAGGDKATLTPSGIAGGDKAAVSVNGIAGGDKAAVSVNGIAGGDKAAVSVNGIAGGDKAALSVNGIAGGDKAALSVNGIAGGD